MLGDDSGDPAERRRGICPRPTEVARRSPENHRATTLPPRTVSHVPIERYTPEMAAQVAGLIEDCFTPHRDLSPMQLLTAPEPWATREELLETLTSERLCADAGHVALEDGRVVSAALAVREGDLCAWWRVATAPDHRRRGLASGCMLAGEAALRQAGQDALMTGAAVDSRWDAVDGLFRSLAYQLDDPQQRNITMVAEDWMPRPLRLPDGYVLETLREDDLDEWMRVRNAVFGGDHGPEWFHARFTHRPDHDPDGWFIVRNDGRIAGIASAICVQSERDPDRLRGGQIEWVGVLDEHRGLHLGEELVVACLNYIAERDHLPALLLTQPFRVPAVRLYEKLGFRTTAAWRRWRKSLT
ncbi:MAG: GNAT family N-acetyltransferase [Armatimonadota bacterium]